MRALLAPLVAVAPLLVAAAPVADAEFDRVWTTEWRWRVAEGLADDDPDAVSAHLPDVSATAQLRRAAYWRGVMARLDRIDRARLSPAAAVNYQVYRQQIAGFLDDARFREWEKPLNGDSAFWGDLQFAARGDFANGERDYRAYLTQLADIPRYLDQQTDNLRAGLARGFTPPAW